MLKINKKCASLVSMKKKGGVNHIVTLNSIKHKFTSLSYLTDIGGPSIKYKGIPFSQLFIQCLLCFFMIRDLTCNESNDKKFPLVLAVGVL